MMSGIGQVGTNGSHALDCSLSHLLGRLGILELRVRQAIATRRAVDPQPDDAFRGLYLSDAHVDWVLASGADWPLAPVDPAAAELRRLEADADEAEARGADLRLRRLSRMAGLTPLDVELLLVALAPDVDPRYEQLYGYLNDDVTRRRAGVGLALELVAGRGPARPGLRSRLRAGAPLLDHGLVHAEDPERPLLSRALSVPDRVSAFLLGDDTPDGDVLRMLCMPSAVAASASPGLAALSLMETSFGYVRERPGTDACSAIRAALREACTEPLVVDLRRRPSASGPPAALARTLAREVLLGAGAVVAGPVDALVDDGDAIGTGTLRELADLVRPLVLWGRRAWEPSWSQYLPLLRELATPRIEERVAAWREATHDLGLPDSDLRRLATEHRMSGGLVARSVAAARHEAAARGTAVGLDALRAGARAQDSAGLARLARRTSPRRGWSDLVLPAETVHLLTELLGVIRRRETVLDDWGLGAGAQQGVSALFAGPSGTGKTMAAEVLARDLGVDLYVVNLATVVDKYVGETEKNLDRIFSEAEGVDGVLFFDEADALFGKRSEVRDAQDRYANIEISYLLQRIEVFGGVALLATNLRANLDEAFARRLDLLVEFTLPGAEDRLRLWRGFTAGIPQAPDIDLEFCAQAFELSGGSIRNATLAAACLAADAERPMLMRDVIRGVQREYRKLGRLCVEAEFGLYAPLLGGARG